jgi:hypothetical protein
VGLELDKARCLLIRSTSRDRAAMFADVRHFMELRYEASARQRVCAAEGPERDARMAVSLQARSSGA